MSTAMVPNRVETPVAPILHRGESDHHAHTVQFYTDGAFLLDELSRFIGSALVAGDAAVVIATKAHRDGLAQGLQSRGLDVARAIEQGRYIALDAAETLAKFTLHAWPDAALFAEVIGSVLGQAAAAADRGKNPHISVFGEMVALLWEQGNPEGAIRLEHSGTTWRGCTLCPSVAPTP